MVRHCRLLGPWGRCFWLNSSISLMSYFSYPLSPSLSWLPLWPRLWLWSIMLMRHERTSGSPARQPLASARKRFAEGGTSGQFGPTWRWPCICTRIWPKVLIEDSMTVRQHQSLQISLSKFWSFRSRSFFSLSPLVILKRRRNAPLYVLFMTRNWMKNIAINKINELNQKHYYSFCSSTSLFDQFCHAQAPSQQATSASQNILPWLSIFSILQPFDLFLPLRRFLLLETSFRDANASSAGPRGTCGLSLVSLIFFRFLLSTSTPGTIFSSVVLDETRPPSHTIQQIASFLETLFEPYIPSKRVESFEQLSIVWAVAEGYVS